MKQVKMVCPTNPPIWVTQEHADAILNHPSNAIAKWQIEGDTTENEENAATVDDKRNKDAVRETAEPGEGRKGKRTRKQAKTT